MISYLDGDSPSLLERRLKTELVTKEIENSNYMLAVSAILYVEVLAARVGPEASDLFKKFMRGTGIMNIAVGMQIARKAQNIRESIGLKTPDAIHIATAIVVKASAFHTFDEKLLNMNGSNDVDGLAITSCEFPGP